MKFSKIALLWVFCWSIGCVNAQFNFLKCDSNIRTWYLQSKHNINTAANTACHSAEFQAALSQQGVSINDINTADFHFVDFDKNGIEDLLFSGKIGNIPYVFLFHQHKQQYQTVIATRGVIYQATSADEETPLNLSIWYTACCGYYICHNTRYACISDNDIAYYNIASQTLAFKGTSFPNVCLPRIIPFYVTETATLRTAPFANDERRIGSNADWRGNGLGLYPPLSTGVIYAETIDEKGVYWYFVRMNNDKGLSIHNDRFVGENEIEDANQNFYYGWLRYDEITITE